HDWEEHGAEEHDLEEHGAEEHDLEEHGAEEHDLEEHGLEKHEADEIFKAGNNSDEDSDDGVPKEVYFCESFTLKVRKQNDDDMQKPMRTRISAKDFGASYGAQSIEPVKPINVNYSSKQRSSKSPSIKRQIEIATSDASQQQEPQENMQMAEPEDSINIPIKRKEPKSPLQELESAADELEGKPIAPTTISPEQKVAPSANKQSFLARTLGWGKRDSTSSQEKKASVLQSRQEPKASAQTMETNQAPKSVMQEKQTPKPSALDESKSQAKYTSPVQEPQKQTDYDTTLDTEKYPQIASEEDESLKPITFKPRASQAGKPQESSGISSPKQVNASKTFEDTSSAAKVPVQKISEEDEDIIPVAPPPQKQSPSQMRATSPANALAQRLGLSSQSKSFGISQSNQNAEPTSRLPAQNQYAQSQEKTSQSISQGATQVRAGQNVSVSQKVSSSPVQESRGAGAGVASLSSKAQKLLNTSESPAQTAVADEIYYAYAKEHYRWLYEIYKMGGMTIDEFREKIKQKMQSQSSEEDANGSGQVKSATKNEAFNNLERVIDKKFKK
ncbi:MAG: hypothetical protein WC492_02215, partial [Candidatus Micrarchaeia archaeon]